MGRRSIFLMCTVAFLSILAIAIADSAFVEVQTDWVSGPGTLGPVSHWGSAFYQSDSITYNITGQISLIATGSGPGAWIKHSIEVNRGIDGHNAILPGDFDGDGDFDLAGAIDGLDCIRVYRNQLVETGTVNYVQQVDITGIPVPSSCLIWCGDVDHDGDPDIVVSSDGLWWLENTGGFNFLVHQIGAQSYGGSSCTVGDVDNDGDMDIIVGQFTSPYILDLWRNDGSQNFTRIPISSGFNSWRVVLGDLNGDSFLDILASDFVYLNENGNFPNTPNWTAGLSGPDGIWIRDFNNDGIKDLLISDEWGTEAIYWYENDGSGTHYTRHTICPAPTGHYYGDGCIAEDIDVDGLPDVVGTYSRVGFFKQIAPNTFQEIVVDNISESHWVYAGNLDYEPGGTDFDLDILATGSHLFAWWENVMTTRYASYGYLESSILEASNSTSWDTLYWEGSRPSGTHLNFFVRSGATPAEIQTAPWQGPLEAPVGHPSGSFDISGITTPGDHYFQYRIEMGGGTESPVVYEISVKYSVTSGGIGVSAPDTTGCPGQPAVDICLNVDDVTGQEIYSVGLTVCTDTSVLIPESVSLNGTIAESWDSPTYRITDGCVKIGMAGTSPLSGSGKLVCIRYRVNPNAEEGESTVIHIADVLFNEGTPPAVIQDGLFTIEEFEISGNLSYFSNSKPIPEAEVFLSGDQTGVDTTDEDGDYALSGLCFGNYVVRPEKEDDLDEAITPYDASLVLRHYVGILSLDPYQRIAGDVTGNCQLTPYDASFILRHYVGLPDSFRTGQWRFVPTSFPINTCNWCSAPRDLEYTPLVSDTTNQDFFGLIYGDPSGNWKQGGKEAAKGNPRLLSLGRVTAIAGEVVTIPVEVDDATGILSAGVTIGYDPQVLEFLGASTSELSSGYLLAYRESQGKVKVGIAGSQELKGTGPIINLQFKVLGSELSSPLTVEEAQLNEGRIPVLTRSGGLDVEAPLPESYSLSQNYPNPFNSTTLIRYTIPAVRGQRSAVSLRIYNIQGELVRTLVDGQQGAGRYEVTWDGCDSFGKSVSSGIYLYRLRAGEFTQTKRMILIK